MMGPYLCDLLRLNFQCNMSPDPPLDFQEKISNPIQSAKKNMQENMSLCLNILGMSKTSDKIPVISSLV